jgi:hypothetical protein
MARLDPGLGGAVAAAITRTPKYQPERLTLLDLVAAVAEFARDEAEVVSTVEHLLQSGQVVLVGQFRGKHLLPN